PVLVNYIREAQIAAGVPRQQVYDFTMYILAGLLLLGLAANALVKPLPQQLPTPNSQLPTSGSPSTSLGASRIPDGGRIPDPGRRAVAAFDFRTAIAWAAVGIPIAWGAWVTFTQA